MSSRRRDVGWTSIFDAMTGLISVHSRNFRIIKANRALAAHLGKSRRKIEGKKCFEAIHGVREPASYCPFRFGPHGLD